LQAGRKGGDMIVDFILTADFLQRKRQQFFLSIRHNKGNKAARETAIERLHTTVNSLEPVHASGKKNYE
jgi:hypothetical protein